jgi:hypothetical protein
MTYFAYTCRGRRVTSVGVLYDFTGNDRNTTVQKVEDMVNEAWVSRVSSIIYGAHGLTPTFVQFADAIKDEPDFFLLVGYVPVAQFPCPVTD